MDNSFSQVIDSAASILILLPSRPNFDTVAAGISLYMSVLERKPVTISCDSPMMVGFNRIIGINKITSDLGNKNLTIKFKGYDAARIEKVSYDIINGEFNLTVVPKTGFTAPAKEQMEIGFKGVSADLVILVGGRTEADFPVLNTAELSGVKIAQIGTMTFSSAKEVMSFAGAASTVSELTAKLIKENGFTIDPDIASNLLMGIEEGSSNFAGSDVTPDTFETFAFLLRSGGNRSPRIKLSPATFPPGAIPTTSYAGAVAPTENIPQKPQEVESQDFEGTQESEQDINPPDDWLQPKIFKGSQTPATPAVPSENKG